MIPESWAKNPIKNLLLEDTTGFWGSPPNGKGDVPVLRSTNLRDNGTIDYSKIAYRSFPEEKIVQKALSKNDILLERSGGGPNTPVGRIAYFDGEETYCFTNFMQRLRPDLKVCNGKFLAYSLWAFHAQGKTSLIQQATTGIRNLNYKEYLAWPILVPPLPEQNKITAILSSVDNAIQATQAVIDQTRRVKQGLMQQLFTRGIGHINLKEKEINQFPKGWKWVNLGDVTNESKLRNDGSFSDNDLYAVTKINGIIPMRERVRGKNLDRCKVVLPTAFAYNPMRINIGSIAQWGGDKPVIVSPDYVVFECDSSKIDGLYLNYIRKSHAWAQFMENAGNGSVRIRIYYKNLADFQFLLPPLLEQKQIVTILKSFDEVLKVEQEKLEQTLIIKRGLMQDLLTGRVRVKLNEVNTT